MSGTTIGLVAPLSKLFKSLKRGGAIAALVTAGISSSALGANYTVLNAGDAGADSLRAAIEAANGDPTTDDVIDFGSGLAGQTINLSSMLPVINKTSGSLTITGLGADQLTISGQDAHRVFFVRSGDVAISDLTIANGLAQGGDGAGTAGNSTGVGGGGGGLGAGAAVFVDSGANVTMSSVVVENSKAAGGAGGNRSSTDLGGGGGGGGLGGDGGYGGGGSTGGGSSAGGGGGGGGLGGNGGNGLGSSAGGGGGETGAGGNGGGGNGSGINSGGGGGHTGGGGGATGTAGSGGAGDGTFLGAGGGGGGGGENGQDGQAYNANGGSNGGRGGDGGYGGGGGGGAEEANANPGTGGDFGGGGGEGQNAPGVGGNGGFAGGGGGSGGLNGTGGTGGFGGGGGGGGTTGGVGGDYGGTGGTTGGGGGGALGGAVFVRAGGTLNLVDFSLSGSSVAAGSSTGNGTAGIARGEAIFLHNVDLEVGVTGSNSATIENSIADNSDGTGGTASSLTKNGTGTLILQGANTYSGGTTVNEGELEGTTLSIQGDIVNNDIVNFNQDTDGTYAGEMSGTGLLSKQGTGTLTLTGDHTQSLGAVAFDGGLKVEGTLSGEASVGVDAVLSGTGEVGALNLYGTIAPGDGIGTMSVTNDAEFNNDSTTQIQLNDGGNTAGVNNDLIDVSGDASLFGGTVSVVVSPGTYTHGTQYTFMTANSVSGAFNSITDDLAFFTAQLGYTSNSVYFTLVADSTDFEAIAATPNQTAVAVYLDSNSVAASGAFDDLLDDLQMMTTSQVHAALEQLSGEIYGTTQQVGIQNTTLILHTLAQQLRPQSFRQGMSHDDWGADNAVSELDHAEVMQVSYQPDGSMQFQRCRAPRSTTWAVGFGIGGNAESDGNAGGLDYGMGGVLVGRDLHRDCTHRIGLFGGYVGAGVDTTSPGARNDMSGGQFGTYLAGRNGLHTTTFVGGFQFDEYESRRAINAGGLNLAARGDYDGWQGFSYLERGFILYESQRWSTQPFAALQYVHIRQNGFTESGAGAANLRVAGLDDDSLRSVLGLRAQLGSGPRRHVTPEFRAAWVHEFLDTDSPVVARFAAVGGSALVAQGLDLGRDWALVGTGLNWNLGRGWSAQANYDAQVNEHQTFHVGSGSVQKSW